MALNCKLKTMNKYAASYLSAVKAALGKMRTAVNKVDPLSVRSSLFRAAPVGAVVGGVGGSIEGAINNWDDLKKGNIGDFYRSLLDSALRGGYIGAGTTMLPSLAVKAVSVPRGVAKMLSAFGEQDKIVKDSIRKFLAKAKITAPPGAPLI